MKLEKIFENREQKESNLRHKFLMKELRVYNSWKYLLKKSNWRYIQKNKLITISFIRRLYYCYGDYDDYYSQFSRSVKPTISYIFEDILGSLVNSYLEARFNKKFEVKINTTIPKQKLIPDISIYKKNSIIPSIIIELKTDLGRKRSSWSKNLNKYVKKYVSLGIPKRNFFYVVISIRNWKKDYNPKNIKKLGIDVNKSLKKEKNECKLSNKNILFLCKEHPNDLKLFKKLELSLNQDHFCDFLEPMFEKINKILS